MSIPSFKNLLQRVSALRLVAVAAAGVLIAGVTVTTLMPPQLSHAQAPAAAARGLPDFADLAEQASPSVVNIRTTERSNGAGRGGV